MNRHPWSPEQRAKFRASMAARHGPRRCDLCGIVEGEVTPRGPAKVLRFQLLFQREDGAHRGVGVMLLDESCWAATAARRRRPVYRRNARPFTHGKLTQLLG